jgi:3',5'-cyclic AMP phosphodiesterase CpdA
VAQSTETDGSCRFTFAIISDTHVRPPDGDQSSPFPVNLKANARARFAVREIARRQPAFTVHLGDMVHPMPSLPTFGAAAGEAKRILAPLGSSLKFVAGNHDVGDKPLKGLPAEFASPESLSLYESHFGASWYAFEHDDCQFVVINSSLLNRGIAAADEQRNWLEGLLAHAGGKRTFLFMHYPPFIATDDEPSHYDNIDEPGRGWLLKLIERYAIEAVFSGHVHHFFYNRYQGSRLYVLPPTSFIRQDYSELFPIEPASEYGRDDTGKYGVTFVDIFERGHALRIVPTEGAELSVGDTADPTMSVAADATFAAPSNRLVAHLRHAWATPIALPYNGPMEEFSRKQARNDALLMRLWQLGIRRLRTPLADLLDPNTRSRVHDFHATGMRFTFCSLEIPDTKAIAALNEARAAAEALQIVCAKTNMDDIADGLPSLRALLDIDVVIGKSHSSADEPRQGSHFAHAVSFGFKWSERHDAVAAVRSHDVRGRVTGLAFQINLGDDLPGRLAELDAFGAASGLKIWANVRLASENPAAANLDDELVLGKVSAAAEASNGLKNTIVEIDTLIDIDRGYNPRHGLLDRRCNLRPAGRWLAGIGGRRHVLTGC